MTIVKAAPAAIAKAYSDKSGKRRQFGIGFVVSTLNEQLAELIRRFRLTAPDVEIVLLDLTALEQTRARAIIDALKPGDEADRR